MRALALDEFLPCLLLRKAEAEEAAQAEALHAGKQAGGGPAPGGGPPHRSAPSGITRKILRKGSRVLQALKDMVGSSPKIYNQVRRYFPLTARGPGKPCCQTAAAGGRMTVVGERVDDRKGGRSAAEGRGGRRTR